ATGKLKEGYAADIIIVDYVPFTPLNANTLNSHLLFGVNGSNVTFNMVNGRVLMQDRNLIGIDKKKIYQQASIQAQKLWDRINK
ncbi:MAG: putative aminohydrolase SsnA, partial [Bacilli bacterium]